MVENEAGGVRAWGLEILGVQRPGWSRVPGVDQASPIEDQPLTPYSLAFYVDVVATGTLLGVGPAGSPDQVTRALGPDLAENSFGNHSLCRDYGLVEFSWDRARADQPWSGNHFTLQVHRLACRDRTLVNEELRARYGRFASRLRFEKLRRLLERRGVPLLEIPEIPANAPYFRTFWQPDSQVAVSTIGTHGEYSTPDNLKVGDVYSIHAPMTAEEVECRKGQAGQHQGGPGRATHRGLAG